MNTDVHNRIAEQWYSHINNIMIINTNKIGKMIQLLAVPCM
jgi:hypothetical protein